MAFLAGYGSVTLIIITTLIIIIIITIIIAIIQKMKSRE